MTTMSTSNSRSIRTAGLAAAMVLVTLGSTGPSSATGFVNYPAYLHDAQHTSQTRDASAITRSGASHLTLDWTWAPDPTSGAKPPDPVLFSTPVVYNGRIYIGAYTGDLYELDETTGHVLQKRSFGYVPPLGSCSRSGMGFVSTAAVATDPQTGLPTVYVYAPDGYLYALDANELSTNWSSPVAIPSTTQNDYFAWGSPTVAAGHIYVGISSNCDVPLVRGGLKEFDQATGALLHTYFTVPKGSVGGSIWTSALATATGSRVVVTTGNADEQGTQPGDSFSIVVLNGTTLHKTGLWTVPGLDQTDLDFGGSPTLFYGNVGGTRTALVGACNKNGRYYAVRLANPSLGPVWSFQVGNQGTGSDICLAAAIWNGTNLFLAGNSTTINGTPYRGSVRAIDPSTGQPLWETGLPGNVQGSPTMSGSDGLIAVATRDNSGAVNAAYLINPKNGALLATVDTLNHPVFAQPVFADNHLLIASKAILFAYKPGT